MFCLVKVLLVQKGLVLYVTKNSPSEFTIDRNSSGVKLTLCSISVCV